MTSPTDRAAEWVYHGAWGVLARWFMVPKEAPSLPVSAGDRLDAQHPSPGYVRYLKFWFWLFLLATDIPLTVGWLILLVWTPWLGLVLAIPAWVLIVGPDILAYVAIHLRYDSTWYVMTDRSVRIRRGIWIIRETTITFENVQNVSVSQGPVQRHFGIADVVITTAGGGGGGSGKHGAATHAYHVGVVQGVEDAPRIRDLIMARVRRSRSAGLGDDARERPPASPDWSAEHVALLRRIAAGADNLAS